MRAVTAQNKNEGIFCFWFNVVNEVFEPVCKDIILDPTRELTGIN
jgi:hypothetical protein